MAAIYNNCSLSYGASTNIRLLKIQSSRSTDTESPISCSLRVVPLNHAPPYTALSYKWGKAQAVDVILLDGKPISVRQNLLDFLVQYREAETMDYLWIDALCINQSCNQERNHQVRMMGQIFAKAQLTISWLGRGPEELSQAVKAISESRDLVSSFCKWSASYYENEAISYTEFLKYHLFAAHVTILFEASYWKRMWVVQEFVLSTEVEIWCGNEKANYEIIQELYNAIAFLDDEDILPDDFNFPNPFRPSSYASKSIHLRGFRQEKLAKMQQISSATIFDSLSLHECADARDRIYGMLGLIDPQELEGFPIDPDYSKPLSTLYLDVWNRRLAQHNTSKKDDEGSLLSFQMHLQLKLLLNNGDENVIRSQKQLKEIYEL